MRALFWHQLMPKGVFGRTKDTDDMNRPPRSTVIRAFALDTIARFSGQWKYPGGRGWRTFDRECVLPWAKSADARNDASVMRATQSIPTNVLVL
jgi:hypothetical protein